MAESLFDIRKIESITGEPVMMHNKQVVPTVLYNLADNQKTRIDWNYLETGNIAADALARQDFKTFKEIYPNVTLKRQHKVIVVPRNEI